MNLAPGTFQGLHPDEVALFRSVLKGMTGIGVEIGCCDGYSSAVILDASALHLTSIDPFIPDSMEPSLCGSRERYEANVALFGKRARLIIGYSEEVIQEERPFFDQLSFLFIDGDHRYTSVVQDWEDWTPLVRTGGLVAMHDARMGREGGANFHPGPSQVAREMLFEQPDKWEIVGEAFSLVIARKK